MKKKYCRKNKMYKEEKNPKDAIFHGKSHQKFKKKHQEKNCIFKGKPINLNA